MKMDAVLDKYASSSAFVVAILKCDFCVIVGCVFEEKRLC